MIDKNGHLHLVHHPDSVFVRLEINTKQSPQTKYCLKKKQDIKLWPSKEG